MRKGIIVLILIAATYFVFPQELEAADLPAGQAPASAPSAYEILGLVPDEDEAPVFGDQAELESAGNPDSVVPIQLEGQETDPTAEPVVSDEPSDVVDPTVVATYPDVEATVEVEESPVELLPVESGEEAATAAEPLPSDSGEAPVVVEPLDLEPDAEPVLEPAEEPLVNERTVPEGETALEVDEPAPDSSGLAEPQEEPAESAASDAGSKVVTDAVTDANAMDESSEDALLAEIQSLLQERKVLTDEISGLKEQNDLLAAKAEETDYYKGLSESMALKIADLEAQLAETELALAESTDALLLAEAGLAAYDETVQELESSLEVSETSLKDTRAYLDILRDELAKAQEEASPAHTTGDAPVDDRIGALAAERDAALAARSQAEAARKAAEAARTAAELSRAATEAALAEALETGIVVVAPGVASDGAGNGYLSGWSLDTSRFTTVIRSDFSDSAARMGSWVIQGAGARQTDASQYFSRLELPLAQDGKPLLYHFKARATGKGWVGLGLHFFVEDVVKRRGYGEGKSLLIWFTRDQAARGVDTTYLQLYRSDNDVVMERMFDAAIDDNIVVWRNVDIVYDPVAEYVAVSVDGVLRIVYKTFFGRTSGATMALRTLGGGVEFADFSVRGE
ncbi:MAG: hypothetical protein AB7T74_16490 [Clostridia bacterium]